MAFGDATGILPMDSSYNARMERMSKGHRQRITDVPTFRDAFRRRQFCLVPISGAVEASYWGVSSGHILSFEHREGKSFLIAGLYDSWIDRDSGVSRQTCTVLTDTPYPYVFEHGHDRSILLLNPEFHHDFLRNTSRNADENFSFLRRHRITQNWTHRTMRKIGAKSIAKNTPNLIELELIRQTVWSKPTVQEHGQSQ